MTRWAIKKYPTVFSFGVKLLLLAGTMGVLSFAGLLDSPSQSAPADALSAQQAETSTGHPLQSSPVAVADVGHVDINHVSVEELQRLPGIGPVLAERIIQYCREHGKFGSIRDIQNVKGIGEKRFAQLEPHIHIDDQALSSDK
ncbi:MAG: helix-hairpin-helix domain-containing protein [Nitrospira sp. SB0666_bin_27]|nr:helix-hairpin-helix domain-containing protein [Nitrospira sp. SB0666_bin_27]MYF25001.1 helix-hairpin-helix domain-containing protein [Nitrospira sp. SB0678_bin_10]MYI89041.1 helix-hairpin-helix domain-containing protein [Gammaproteobacteria bacterium]